MLVNRAKMTTATTGTGTITLGSAVDGYQTFAAAGVTDAAVVSYVIEDGTAWEIGTGTYTASGPTLSRTVTESSNAGAAINLSGNAVVFVTARAEDLATGGGDPTLATSSGATQSVDFSTSNKIHVATIDAEATISFVNPAQVAKVDLILDVKGQPYDLLNAVYDGVESPLISVAGTVTTTVARNGSFVYVANYGSDRVEQYAVATPGDITTMGTSFTALSTTSFLTGGPAGMGFSIDGTSFITGDGSVSKVVAFDLTSPWDLSTATNRTDGTGAINNYAVSFNTDGSQFIATSSDRANTVVKTLGTPYKLNTESSSVSVDLTSFAFTAPRSIWITEDGNYVFILCQSTDTVYQYPLSTSNDLSTIQNTLVASKNVSAQESQPAGAGFVPNLGKMWVLGGAVDKVQQYSTGGPFLATLPANLQSPNIPHAIDEKTAIQIVTYDGGTTYQAINVQGGIK